MSRTVSAAEPPDEPPPEASGRFGIWTIDSDPPDEPPPDAGATGCGADTVAEPPDVPPPLAGTTGSKIWKETVTATACAAVVTDQVTLVAAGSDAVGPVSAT